MMRLRVSLPGQWCRASASSGSASSRAWLARAGDVAAITRQSSSTQAIAMCPRAFSGIVHAAGHSVPGKPAPAAAPGPARPVRRRSLRRAWPAGVMPVLFLAGAFWNHFQILRLDGAYDGRIVAGPDFFGFCASDLVAWLEGPKPGSGFECTDKIGCRRDNWLKWRRSVGSILTRVQCKFRPEFALAKGIY